MIKHGMSAKDFLGHYNSQYQKLMGQKPARSEWDYDKNMSIIGVFNMLLARIKKDGNHENLLSFISCFGPRRVAVNLMGQVHGPVKSSLSSNSDCPDVQRTDEMIWLDRLCNDQLEFQVTTGQLESLCALKRNRDSEGNIIGISLHDSITRWRFETLTDDAREKWVLAAAYALSKCLPEDIVDPKPQMEFLPLVRHFYNIIRRYIDTQKLEAPAGEFCQQYGNLMTRFAPLYLNSRHTVEGESVFIQALSYKQVVETSSWPKGRRTLLLLKGFAMMLSKNGKMEEAAETTETLHDASTEQLGPEDEITCWAAARLPAIRETKLRNANDEHRAVIASQGGKLSSSTPGPTSNESLPVPPPRLVHEHDEELSTRLRNAAIAGDIEAIKSELYHGADINDNTANSFTALSAASQFGHVLAVRLLLDRGADINARDGYSSTALFRASHKGHLSVVEMLLRYGADVNVKHEDFGTALHETSDKGHIAIAELLLSHGADVDAIARKSGTALQIVATRGHTTMAELLLKNGADINVYGQSNDTALYQASVEGHIAMVELLLKNGAYVNLCGKMNYTPLHAASWKGHTAVAELLLKNGADINLCSDSNGTPLHLAARYGHTAVVELLLNNRADINVCGELDGAPLGIASWYGRTAVVESLLNHGANVDTIQFSCATALQLAACKGHQSIVELLLHKGADVNAQHGTYGNALYNAAGNGHRSLVELLLIKGADINAKYATYGTALHAATFNGYLRIVQLLIKGGADVNTRIYWGTPLQIALYQGHSDLVALLKAAGARDDD